MNEELKKEIINKLIELKVSGIISNYVVEDNRILLQPTLAAEYLVLDCKLETPLEKLVRRLNSEID